MNKPISFMPQAWDDYLYWQTQDKKTLKRINKLLQDIARSNFEGLGKAEPLKYGERGYWSRRINDTNRVVYEITEQAVIIISCRGHYE